MNEKNDDKEPTIKESTVCHIVLGVRFLYWVASSSEWYEGEYYEGWAGQNAFLDWVSYIAAAVCVYRIYKQINAPETDPNSPLYKVEENIRKERKERLEKWKQKWRQK